MVKNEKFDMYSEYLSADDWSLTLKELRGQRVQLLLQLSVVNASIAYLEGKVDE